MEAWRATISKNVHASHAYRIVSTIILIYSRLVDLLFGPVVHFSVLFISSLLSYRGKNVQKWGSFGAKNPCLGSKCSPF